MFSNKRIKKKWGLKKILEDDPMVKTDSGTRCEEQSMKGVGRNIKMLMYEGNKSDTKKKSWHQVSQTKVSAATIWVSHSTTYLTF